MKGTKKHIVLSAITLAIVLIFGAGIAYAWFTTEDTVTVTASVQAVGVLSVKDSGGTTDVESWAPTMKLAAKDKNTPYTDDDDTSDIAEDSNVTSATWTVKSTVADTPVFIYAIYTGTVNATTPKLKLLVKVGANYGKIQNMTTKDAAVLLNTDDIASINTGAIATGLQITIYAWIDGVSADNDDMSVSLPFTLSFETEARS